MKGQATRCLVQNEATLYIPEVRRQGIVIFNDFFYKINNFEDESNRDISIICSDKLPMDVYFKSKTTIQK